MFKLIVVTLHPLIGQGVLRKGARQRFGTWFCSLSGAFSIVRCTIK